MGNGFDKKAQKSEKRSDFYYRMFRWERLKSLGQAFLKACRIQKDRVFCLQAKPMRKLFHGWKTFLSKLSCVSKTQNIIKKIPGEKLRVKEERKMDLSGGSRCYDYSRTWLKKVSEGGGGVCEYRRRKRERPLLQVSPHPTAERTAYMCKAGRKCGI